ncbi:MAG: hypothetical protein QM628_15285 [Propionicimonas sp.]
MKLIRLAAIASGLALTATLVAPTAAAASPSRPALLPAAKPKAVGTAKIDVDGDGRKDTVKVTRLSSTKYKVAVTTAKKKASITITSTIRQDWGEDNPYWGAAKLDKVKGHELLVLTGGGDGVSIAALTWRKGKLIRQAAPKARSSKYAWYSLGTDWGHHGYRFYTKNGKRYVEQYGLFKMGTPRWEGTIVTSKWTASGWKQTKKKNVSLTDAQAGKYPGGFVGVKIVHP